MSDSEPRHDDPRPLSIPVRGAVAVVLSVGVNLGLLQAGTTLGIAPEFQALSVPPVAFLSVFGASCATAVYWLLDRYARRPRRTFLRVAMMVLALSFLPSIALHLIDPNATVPGVAVLLIMHVTVAAASVGPLVYWRER